MTTPGSFDVRIDATEDHRKTWQENVEVGKFNQAAHPKTCRARPVPKEVCPSRQMLLQILSLLSLREELALCYWSIRGYLASLFIGK